MENGRMKRQTVSRKIKGPMERERRIVTKVLVNGSTLFQPFVALLVSVLDRSFLFDEALVKKPKRPTVSATSKQLGLGPPDGKTVWREGMTLVCSAKYTPRSKKCRSIACLRKAAHSTSAMVLSAPAPTPPAHRFRCGAVKTVQGCSPQHFTF